MPASITRPARCAPFTARAAGACFTSSATPRRAASQVRQARRRHHAGELARLEAILKQARINGVEGIEIIDGAAAKRLEPQLACIAAMRSPETGIIDSHRSCWRCAAISRITAASSRSTRRSSAWRRLPAAGRSYFGGSDAQSIVVDAVVNCAGLGAQRLGARDRRLSARAHPAARSRQRQLFRFRRPAGILAAHLSGPGARRARRACHARSRRPHALRAGRRVDRARELRCRPGRAAAFYQRIRDYWPALPDNSLAPDYAGIRPKLTGPGEPALDFMIDGPPQHGLAGWCTCSGSNCRGLTCALSIGDEVADYLSA